MAKDLPTPDELRKLLSYDPETGVLTRRGWNAGKEAGWLNGNGYLRICINYRQLYAHRVAWAMTYGHWPLGQIDHINCDRADNRLENLRDTTTSENLCNRASGTSGSTSKFLGVHFDSRSKRRKRWVAAIARQGKRRTIGFYLTEEEAARARDAVAIEWHGEFASLNFKKGDDNA